MAHSRPLDIGTSPFPSHPWAKSDQRTKPRSASFRSGSKHHQMRTDAMNRWTLLREELFKAGVLSLQPYRRRSLCRAYVPQKRAPGKAKEHLNPQGCRAGDVKLPPLSSPSLFLCQQPMQGDQIFIASVELNNTSM